MGATWKTPGVSRAFGLIASDFPSPLRIRKKKASNFFFFTIDLEELYHSQMLELSFFPCTGRTDSSPLCCKFFSQKV